MRKQFTVKCAFTLYLCGYIYIYAYIYTHMHRHECVCAKTCFHLPSVQHNETYTHKHIFTCHPGNGCCFRSGKPTHMPVAGLRAIYEWCVCVCVCELYGHAHVCMYLSTMSLIHLQICVLRKVMFVCVHACMYVYMLELGMFIRHSCACACNHIHTHMYK